MLNLNLFLNNVFDIQFSNQHITLQIEPKLRRRSIKLLLTSWSYSADLKGSQ